MPAVDELIAEVAEAEAAGLKAEDLATLRGQIEGAAAFSGMSMAYQVPDTEKAAWFPAWRLSVDHAGRERGEPTMLPKDALGRYLAKRRPIDGGRLFTLKMPELLGTERPFKCFAAPNMCGHMSDTKQNLIDHMEAAHPRESGHLKLHIDQLRAAAQNENVDLQKILSDMINTPDPGSVKVPDAVRQAYDETVTDEPVVNPLVTTMSVIPRQACPVAGCAYITPDGGTRPDFALSSHTRGKHNPLAEPSAAWE